MFMLMKAFKKHLKLKIQIKIKQIIFNNNFKKIIKKIKILYDSFEILNLNKYNNIQLMNLTV